MGWAEEIWRGRYKLVDLLATTHIIVSMAILIVWNDAWYLSSKKMAAKRKGQGHHAKHWYRDQDPLFTPTKNICPCYEQRWTKSQEEESHLTWNGNWPSAAAEPKVLMTGKSIEYSKLRSDNEHATAIYSNEHPRIRLKYRQVLKFCCRNWSLQFLCELIRWYLWKGFVSEEREVDRL